MAIAFDVAIGSTGTGTGEAASLNHAANVMVIVCVAYMGTTSPNSITIGGNAMTLLLKNSQSTTMTTEVYYKYVTAAANDSISIGFAGSTRHAWSAVSYTGASSAGAGSFEGTTHGENFGASVQTATVSLAGGTANRMAISAVGGSASTGSGTIAVAPANSETERREDDLAGTISTAAVSSQLQEFNSSTLRNMQASLTKTSATITWSIVTFGLLPAVTSIPNKIFQINQSVNRSYYY